jgi:hypothetical protein
MAARSAYRCDPRPDACPASRSVVVLDRECESTDCPVCRRRLKVCARRDGPSGEMIAIMPAHKRRDLEAARQAARQLAALEARHRKALKRARVAWSKRRSWRSAADSMRAIYAAASALPVSPRRNAWLARAWRERQPFEQEPAPRAAGAIIRELEAASNIDLGAVEPDNWPEHVSAVNAKLARQLEREPPFKRIPKGLRAIIAKARPRTLLELENEPFRGSMSVLEWAREFPGLENLRLPDAAYQSPNADIPF